MTTVELFERATTLWEAVMDNYPGGRNATNFGKWLDDAAGPGGRYSGVDGVVLRFAEFLEWTDELAARVPQSSPRVEADTVWFGPRETRFGVVAKVRRGNLVDPAEADPLRAIFGHPNRARATVVYELGRRLAPGQWSDRVSHLLDGVTMQHPRTPESVVADLPLVVPAALDIEGPWTQVVDEQTGREVASADAIGVERLLVELEETLR